MTLSQTISRAVPKQQNPVILVVDDEPSFCTVVCEILRLFGFNAQLATNAGEALTSLDAAIPDLILTDVMMPGVDGLTFVRRLRANPNWMQIPAIVVSAMTSAEDMQAALEAGANGFLAKPFSAEELRAMVSRHIPQH